MTMLDFAPEARWDDLPEGWCLGDVAGVAVDAANRVHVFHRGEHPIIVFEGDGGSCARSARASSLARTRSTSLRPASCSPRTAAITQCGS